MQEVPKAGNGGELVLQLVSSAARLQIDAEPRGLEMRWPCHGRQETLCLFLPLQL